MIKVVFASESGRRRERAGGQQLARPRQFAIGRAAGQTEHCLHFSTSMVIPTGEAAGAVKHNIVITIWHRANPSFVGFAG